VAKKFVDERFSKQPMQMKDMTPDQADAANTLVETHLKNLPTNMLKTADNLRKQAANSPKESAARTKSAKATRLEQAAPHIPAKAVTLDDAADNRVHYVERAATDLRMPHEHFAGLGWYFGANQKIQDAVGDHDHATNVSSSLSPGQAPEKERASAAALIDAHSNGSVHFNRTLASAIRKNGGDVTGLEGQHVPFSQIPAHIIPHLLEPKHSATVERQSTGVNWSGIKQVSLPNTITKAHKILTGELETAFEPAKAPKTWSYEQNIAASKPQTPEHFEYMLRGADLASKIRGEENIGQQMFDYVGLRGSNSGQLSNHGHTAEDTWQQSITTNSPDPKTMKAAGDVALTGKTANGVSVSPDARIGAPAVRHAWENEATHRTAVKLQDKYQTDYTVPTTMVQETGWTAVRRHAQVAKGTKNVVTADQEYNQHLKGQRAAAAAETKQDKQKSKQFTQLEMF
jgi:hypothetical protein